MDSTQAFDFIKHSVTCVVGKRFIFSDIPLNCAHIWFGCPLHLVARETLRSAAVKLSIASNDTEGQVRNAAVLQGLPGPSAVTYGSIIAGPRAMPTAPSHICGRIGGARSKMRRYSITSSAWASRVGGTSRPSAWAVVKLMTRSNLVGCSTGMSPGFAPRRILSTKSAARLHMCGQFGP